MSFVINPLSLLDVHEIEEQRSVGCKSCGCFEPTSAESLASC